jgi:glutathione synthase/RimK-type ligase-like ATP-grasp enzyme
MKEVGEALRRRDAPFFFLDQRETLKIEVELSVDERVEGSVRIGDRTCDLAKLRSVYVRYQDYWRLSEMARADETGAGWRHAQAVDKALGSWLEVTPALVINPLSAMGSNCSKPYQLSLIRSVGFETPETLITTDPQAAREFWERHGIVVYKSISAVRSIVSRLGAKHVDRLEDLHWCPTQFQQYIPGRDYRVHVVGQEVFACEIDSNADDYRYATRQGGYVKLRPYSLSGDCAGRCKVLAAGLGLVVAGVDLRQTPDGRWYCFEVNSSPAFTYYEAPTSKVIAEAVASLLVEGSSS